MSALVWTGAGACWAFSAWIIVETIVEVARGHSRAFGGDAIAAGLLHGGLAVLGLWLASLAGKVA